MSDNITNLNPNEIFVFGSNLAGRHGKGAARLAHKKFNARYGQGVGLQGQAYAIPTKDENLEVLPIETIKEHVDTFIEFAKSNPNYSFLVTPIGTGLAGYSPFDIAPLFKEATTIDNIVLPNVFISIIETL